MADFNVKLEGDKELVARFAHLPDAVRQALVAKTTTLALKLQAKVVNDKLSGQVLNRVTGNLAGSIKNATDDAPEKVTGRVFSDGSVKYAGFWEFGFHGAEAVSSHSRTIKEAFGKALSEAKTFTVRAYTRQVDQDARSFLRSSLGDMKDEILAGLSDAAAEAMGREK